MEVWFWGVAKIHNLTKSFTDFILFFFWAYVFHLFRKQLCYEGNVFAIASTKALLAQPCVSSTCKTMGGIRTVSFEK